MSEIALLDTFTTPDQFATGLAKIEPVGSGACVRLYFTVEHQDHADGRAELVIVARLIVPFEELAAIGEQLLTRRKMASVPRFERVQLNG